MNDVPFHVRRNKYIFKHGSTVLCKICNKPFLKMSTVIKVNIPKQLADDRGWFNRMAPKSKDQHLLKRGRMRGYFRCLLHWHCYRDWEFRLDKLKKAFE